MTTDDGGAAAGASGAVGSGAAALLDRVGEALARTWDFVSGQLLWLVAAAALLLCFKFWWRRRHAIVFDPWLDRTGAGQADLGATLASMLLHRIREIQAVHERSIRRFELWNPNYEVPAFQQPIDEDIRLLASLELGRYGELVGRLVTLLFKLLPLAQPAQLRGTVLTLGDHLFLQLTLDGFRVKGTRRRAMRVLEARGKSGDLGALPELVEELAYKVYLELIESQHFKSWRAFKAWVAGLGHYVDFLDVESDEAWKNAKSCYDEALLHERNNAAASYNLGVLHYVRLSAKDNPLAIDRFRSALMTSDPELKAHAMSGLANALGQAVHRHGVDEPRLLEEARFLSQRALDLSPGSDVVQKAYAFICHQESERLAKAALAADGATRARLTANADEQREAAIRHYREAIRINPHYFAAYNNLANLFLERARQLPQDDVRRRGLLKDALRECDHAIRTRPSWHLPYDNAANAWIELAAHEEPARCHEQAEAQLKNALLNQPRYAEALNDWARLELHRAPDRPELAVERHRRALAACDAATDGGRRNKLCRQFSAEAKIASVAFSPEAAINGCSCSTLAS